jgi:hypothetical protein
MALGDSARAQVIVAKAKGWDPNKIEGSGEDISAFNNVPDVAARGDFVVGNIPNLPTHEKGFPDGFDTNIGEPRVTFNAPDVGRENVNRRTSGANPIPGMPGAA